MRGLAALACAFIRTANPSYRIHSGPSLAYSHSNSFFTSSHRAMSSASFLETLKVRRTRYELSKETTVPDSKVVQIVEEAIKHSPTSFNSQTSRAVVLFGDHHDKLWDIAIDSIKTTLGEEKGRARIEKTNASFKGAYGTVLFFEDQAVINAMIERTPFLADYFPVWSANAAGMVQLAVWTALATEGLGASLQHYNPIIDEAVQKEFGLPSTWALTAQMPFGKPSGPANPNKEFKPISERVKVFGANNQDEPLKN